MAGQIIVDCKDAYHAEFYTIETRGCTRLPNNMIRYCHTLSLAMECVERLQKIEPTATLSFLGFGDEVRYQDA